MNKRQAPSKYYILQLKEYMKVLTLLKGVCDNAKRGNDSDFLVELLVVCTLSNSGGVSKVEGRLTLLTCARIRTCFLLT